jgi:hypothetical protein
MVDLAVTLLIEHQAVDDVLDLVGSSFDPIADTRSL